jgi:hypothetical protein
MRRKAVNWIALCVSLGAVAWGDDDPGADQDPTLKPVVKQLKVVSVDPGARALTVKEKDYEVFWSAKKTVFFHHQSLFLKDLKKDAVLQFLGKCHERKSGGGSYADSDPLISDVEYVGMGAAFVQPPINSQKSGVLWHEGRLTVTKYPFSLEVDKTEYRVAGNDKMAAYSLEPIEPQKLEGKMVTIRGTMRKVKVERNGKPVEVNRIYASEVHLVELLPEHKKVFQLQWVERKGDGPGKAGKK